MGGWFASHVCLQMARGKKKKKLSFPVDCRNVAFKRFRSNCTFKQKQPFYFYVVRVGRVFFPAGMALWSFRKVTRQNIMHFSVYGMLRCFALFLYPLPNIAPRGYSDATRLNYPARLKRTCPPKCHCQRRHGIPFPPPFPSHSHLSLLSNLFFHSSSFSFFFSECYFPLYHRAKATEGTSLFHSFIVKNKNDSFPTVLYMLLNTIVILYLLIMVYSIFDTQSRILFISHICTIEYVDVNYVYVYYFFFF